VTEVRNSMKSTAYIGIIFGMINIEWNI